MTFSENVELSPLQFTSGQTCRRNHLPFPEEVEKKKLIAVILGGAVSSNLFGHVAIAIEGHGTYSFGTKTTPGSSLYDYLASQGKYRSSIVYTIEATEKQAELVAESIKKEVGKPLPDPRKDPKGFADTCSSRTIKALEAGGFQNPKPTMFGPSPSIFPRDAANYGREYGAAHKIPQGSQIPDIFRKF